MSRFVDRSETIEVDLGACQCPNTPHQTDSARVRKHLSYADQLHLADAFSNGMSEAVWAMFNLRVASWNLVDERGKPVGLSRANWQNLDPDTAKVIQDAINDLSEAEDVELPNA